MGILPSGDFPNGEFPNSVPAAALGPQHVLVSALGFLAEVLGPHCSLMAPQRALPNLWKVAAWEIDYLGSWH